MLEPKRIAIAVNIISRISLLSSILIRDCLPAAPEGSINSNESPFQLPLAWIQPAEIQMVLYRKRDFPAVRTIGFPEILTQIARLHHINPAKRKMATQPKKGSIGLRFSATQSTADLFSALLQVPLNPIGHELVLQCSIDMGIEKIKLQGRCSSL